MIDFGCSTFKSSKNYKTALIMTSKTEHRGVTMKSRKRGICSLNCTTHHRIAATFFSAIAVRNSLCCTILFIMQMNFEHDVTKWDAFRQQQIFLKKMSVSLKLGYQALFKNVQHEHKHPHLVRKLNVSLKNDCSLRVACKLCTAV